MKSLLLATALVAPAVFASTAGASVSPPQPTGASPVGFTRTTLTDHFRVESLAGDTGSRRVPIRVWYPAAARGSAPAPLFTAAEQARWERAHGLPSGAFDGLGSAATAGAPPARGSHPVLLMSPGRARARGADGRPGRRPRQPRLRGRRRRRAGRDARRRPRRRRARAAERPPSTSPPRRASRCARATCASCSRGSAPCRAPAASTSSASACSATPGAARPPRTRC